MARWTRRSGNIRTPPTEPRIPSVRGPRWCEDLVGAWCDGGRGLPVICREQGLARRNQSALTLVGMSALTLVGMSSVHPTARVVPGLPRLENQLCLPISEIDEPCSGEGHRADPLSVHKDAGARSHVDGMVRVRPLVTSRAAWRSNRCWSSSPWAWFGPGLGSRRSQRHPCHQPSCEITYFRDPLNRTRSASWQDIPRTAGQE